MKDPSTPQPKVSARAAPRLFMNQPNMRRVVYALVPLAISGIYFFGWRVAAVLAVCNAAGLVTERITSRRRGQPISTACFVTCWLYGLSLPPTVPLWIAAVGVVVAILFGKEVFGGFGRNFANPAIVGRAFVYVCFPRELTAGFVPAFKAFPGGLAHWSFQGLERLPDYLAHTGRSVADAVTQASPMWVNKAFGADVAAQGASLWEMFTGGIGGVFTAEGQTRILAAGSIGEGCAVLIILAAVYLLVTRTANWRLPLSCLLGLGFATLLLRNLLGFDGSDPSLASRYVVPPLPFTLLAGTTLYVTVFMVTDPVSAPKQRPAQYAYGFLIGFLIVFLRWRGIFVAAASFAVLLGNMTGPLLDMAAKAWADRRSRAKAAVEGGPPS